MSPLEELKQRIDSRDAHIGVIGLGYVGLPLAVEFTKAGFRVTGFDLDGRQDRGAGRRPFVHHRRVRRRDPHGARLRSLPGERELRGPRARGLHQRVRAHAAHQDQGSRRLVHRLGRRGRAAPAAVRAARGARQHHVSGHDPRALPPDPRGVGARGRRGLRAWPSRRSASTPPTSSSRVREVPKVVGGETPLCTELGAKVFEAVFDHVVPVSSTQCAEMVKLLENTFRAINIGLANEVALMCDRLGLDVWEVIEAAATKPYGFMKFQPGPGPRRPLHPGGSQLSRLEAAQSLNFQRPLHRDWPVEINGSHARARGRRAWCSDILNRGAPVALNGAKHPRCSVHGLQVRRGRYARVARPWIMISMLLAPAGRRGGLPRRLRLRRLVIEDGVAQDRRISSDHAPCASSDLVVITHRPRQRGLRLRRQASCASRVLRHPQRHRGPAREPPRRTPLAPSGSALDAGPEDPH